MLALLCKLRSNEGLCASTRYVVGGSKGVPYVETHPVMAVGVYGASRKAGISGCVDARDEARGTCTV